MKLNVIEKDIHQTTEDSQNSTSDFVNVDISEFYGEEEEQHINSTDIVFLTPTENALVERISARLKKTSPETLLVISNRFSDIKHLAWSIAQFPSLLESQAISFDEKQTQHSLVENLLKPRDGDKTLHYPAKAIMGKGFLVAKFQAFSSLTKIAIKSNFPDNDIADLRSATQAIMYTIMAEDVYTSLLGDLTIPIDIRREIAYSLLILWEHRSDQNVKDIAPVLDTVWNAKRKLAPAFGTMVGTSELLLLSIEMDDDWRNFINTKLEDKQVSMALEEFLFGLSYEQIQSLRTILREKGIPAIGRDEVSFFLGEPIHASYEFTPKDFFLLYSIRRENAVARKRMKIDGPHSTLEDHYMRFILEKNKEKQYNDIYAK